MSETGLLCLVYLSRAVEPMGDAALLKLLRQSRANNQRDGITGLLLYRQGRFMQALEGPHELVHALYRRIGMDARHTGISTVIKFKTEERAFGGWSMGFANVDRIPETDREGFSPFLNQSFDPAHWNEAPHQAVRLLKAFRDTDRLVQV